MTRSLKISVFLLFVSCIAHAQQLPVFSQYMLNGFVINPAMAGSDGFTTFDLLSRQQWLGMENAPRTVSFSAQTRLLWRSYMIKSRPMRQNKYIPARSGRIGLGLNVYSDRNGFFEQSGASFTYSYHIRFPNSQLSFGLAGSMAQYKLDPKGFEFRNYDPKLANLGQPTYVPDAAIGCYYEHLNYYAGFSVSNIVQSNIKFGNKDLSAYQIQRHYYLLAGYRLDGPKHYVYEPTLLLKTTEMLQPQVDLSFKVTYYDYYWMGLSYRTEKTFIAFMGMTWKNFSAGYAFDYDFNAFQRFSFGSHELNMILRFGDSAKRYKWIRRY
jgi:type IX secretion system PorP/SprF family membrane protein